MGEEKERKQAFSSKYNSLINVLTPLLQDKCLILLENVKTDTDFWIVKNINILQLIFVEKQESKNELIQISNMSFPFPQLNPLNPRES